MSKKLFVGNLSFKVTDFDLEDLFKQYGEIVSAKVVVDRMTGRSKGYGFVEMNAEDTAKTAMEGLNGADVKGRPINVSYAKSQDGDRGEGNNRGFRGRDYSGNNQRNFSREESF